MNPNGVLCLIVLLCVALTACTPATPSPAAAPPKPTEPAKPAAATSPSPAASPAASPSPAAKPAAFPSPSPSPSPSPAAAAPAAKPVAARPPGDTTFPNRPINFIVPFAPGGSTDVGARIAAEIASREFGQPVVVVNRAGAGGQIGWTELAQARPDGYTIGMINLPHLHTTYLDPERQAAFTADDIVPLVSQALDPTQVAVRSDSPWQTLDQLIADAKSRPGQIVAGIVGYLQDDEIGYFQLAEAAGGWDMRRVYFDSGAPAITALLGGQIEVFFGTVGDNYAQTQAGAFRVLTTMDAQRSKFYPQVPTAAEIGFPGVISSSTRGIAVPKDVPEPIMRRLEDVFARAMESPEHLEKIEGAGQPVRVMVGEEFRQYYRDNQQVARRWVDLILKTGRN